ncbi:fumarate lyase, partial [Rhizobium leguminosarum]
SQKSGYRLIPARNFIEATSDTGGFVSFVLEGIAFNLTKICNDLRLLSSGPRGGLGEIRLPPVQAGSSIMPGKGNPFIPEMMNQISFQVIGNDLTVTLAASAGQLQLNAMEPVIVLNILQSMRMLTRG